MLFAPKPVTMRTLDVGGDKPLPYFTIEEANPFLGWRGIRVTLDHSEILLARLRAINQVVEESHRWGKSVSVCGEMAGDPAAALLLLGMGVESLSMAGPDLPRVKRVIRTFSQVQARQLVDQTLRLEDASEVRGVLTDALDQAGLGGLVRAGQ